MKKILSIALVLPALVMAKASEDASQEKYSSIISSYQKKNWKEVIGNAKSTIKEFPDFPFLSDIYFYTGVAYFNSGDYELANYYFSTFLKDYASPKYFEEAIVYKFQIAEKFETGARKHLMGWEGMPQWVSASDDALALYDEVITTLPKHEVAAKALYNKGTMLARAGKYKESIEQFHTLIRRFTKNTLAPESYVSIANIYLEQCDEHFPDPAFLDLARLNLKKFNNDFPSDARIKDVESMLGQMQDQYAKDLWASASYFDKKKKATSALMYYNAIMSRYPESSYVPGAVKRIAAIKAAHPELHVPSDTNQLLTAN